MKMSSNRSLLGLVTFLLVAGLTNAAAQLGAPLSMFSPSIAIEPKVAQVGVERLITVSGQWSSGCPPTGLTLLTEIAALSSVLPLRLDVPPTQVCTAVISSYRFTAAYTPTTAGDYQLIAFASTGSVSSVVTMAVQSSNPNRALYSLTGMWFDVRTIGSGLIFTHSFTTSDAVFGGWFLYDQQGLARWYSIQGGSWITATEYRGQLYETTARPASCAGNLVLCPLPAQTIRPVGSVRITMQDRLNAIAEALAPDGSLMFSLTVTRPQ